MASERPRSLTDSHRGGQCPVRIDSAEATTGRLGAVLRAPRGTGLTPLGPHGPWLATDLATARRVLTDAAGFDFPSTVSRGTDMSASTGESRTGHLVYAPLSPAQVARGREVFRVEWHRALQSAAISATGSEVEAMDLLRRPVARATCSAVLDLDGKARDLIADRVLARIDALAPVISSRHSPRPWSRARRGERRARAALEESLADLLAARDTDDTPPVIGNLLAAGIQCRSRRGAWLLVFPATHPDRGVDPDHAAWESLRMAPPTRVTARVTTAAVSLGDAALPAGAVVPVSPLLLGRLAALSPDQPVGLEEFCPERWRRDDVRPGARLPFGAGAHACPGRALGLTMLRDLATWSGDQRLALSAPVSIDQSRGILPSPARITVTPPTQ
ncbi:cytochrome P450 [Nocardioides sp. B-3]|uniref:cytochrome P450 n=1 Tax=Nocardioides sp. B-3 TaxID=2895565 RepID=UPI0021535419|nr:cytochrome P450 [Nocardioides sp. B-3]UUZ61571.1 cytochrome P450 [Nocardioides sp. B-3]